MMEEALPVAGPWVLGFSSEVSILVEPGGDCPLR
jgi:hypothetical protein